MLPIADVVQLENTKFVDGLDMAGFWKLPSPCFGGESVMESGEATLHLKEHYRDDVAYHKAVLYGQVATWAAGFEMEDFFFEYPNKAEVTSGNETLISFLYAVRKFKCTWHLHDSSDSVRCELIFPERYRHTSSCPLEDKEAVVEAIVQCFGGELPTILPQLQLYDTHRFNSFHFWREVIYLGTHGYIDRTVSGFLKSIVSVAHNLEVVILEGVYDDSIERASLDDLCTFLSTHPTFLSRFRLLKLVAVEQGYVVSHDIFDQLIKAYFSAATTHPQKLHFEDVKIKSLKIIRDSLTVKQQYKQFKSITLENCEFVSNFKANPTAIAEWLNQDICVQEEDSFFNLWQFTIKDGSTHGRKRTYSELEEASEV